MTMKSAISLSSDCLTQQDLLDCILSRLGARVYHPPKRLWKMSTPIGAEIPRLSHVFEKAGMFSRIGCFQRQ